MAGLLPVLRLAAPDGFEGGAIGGQHTVDEQGAVHRVAGEAEQTIQPWVGFDDLAGDGEDDDGDIDGNQRLGQQQLHRLALLAGLVARGDIAAEQHAAAVEAAGVDGGHDVQAEPEAVTVLSAAEHFRLQCHGGGGSVLDAGQNVRGGFWAGEAGEASAGEIGHGDAGDAAEGVIAAQHQQPGGTGLHHQDDVVGRIQGLGNDLHQQQLVAARLGGA